MRKKILKKKRLFLIDFIEKGGYEKMIKNVEKTLETIDNDFTDEEQVKIEFCKHCIILIDILYDAFINKDIKRENVAKDDVYFLYVEIDINQILSKNDKKEKEKESEDKINKLKEIVINAQYLPLVKNIILFLLKFYKNSKESLSKYCFKLFLKLTTTNIKLFEQIKKEDSIKKNISDLIKYNINNKERFFIQSLMSYINKLSSSKQEKNKDKLDNEFLIYLFEISNSLFNELIINKNEEKRNFKK